MALDPQFSDAIKGFEGYAAQPTWDYKQYSAGYGTKVQPGDENIPQDQLKAVHEQRYQAELEKAAAHVDAINPNLPPGARAALTSLTYNAGPGWANSGLGEMVKAGNLEGAAQRFLQYNKAGGEVLPGLVARRAKEAAWFAGGSTPAPQPAPAATASPPMAAPAAPLDIAPPIFAAPQAAPQQQAQAAPMQFEPPPQMAPIFFPKRHSPDLTKLRAVFKAPVFSRG